MKKVTVTLLIALVLLTIAIPTLSQEMVKKANGQMVYLPANTFSSYYLDDDDFGGVFQHHYVGASTPFIRSLDPVNSIRIDSIQYTHFTPEGIKEEFDVLPAPKILGPLETISYSPGSLGIPFDYIPDFGDNYTPPFYLIRWSALDKGKVNAPMIAAAFTQSERASNQGGRYRPMTQLAVYGVILEEY